QLGPRAGVALETPHRHKVRLRWTIVIVERTTVEPLKETCDLGRNLQLLTSRDYLAQTHRGALVTIRFLGQMLQSDKRKKQSLHPLLRNDSQQLASIASCLFAQQHERAAGA